jgi:hypothetical protein
MIQKNSRVFWGSVTDAGKFVLSDPIEKEAMREWLKKHASARVGLRFIEENEDFSLPWLRFWRGVICREFMKIWEGYTNDDAHLALKFRFFNVAEPGMPPRVPSFSRSGEAGETLIRKMLPEVIEYAASLGLVISEKGEFEDYYTSKVYEYDLNEKPYK